jgi:biofilm PGA synthesis N-glycosyltransferase PgaC
MSYVQIIIDIFTYLTYTYTGLLIGSYIFMALFSIGETRKYLHKNSFVDYRLLATSLQSPKVSIIAPAYNEGATIIENVRSLLSIYYNNLEVIIVNDGSKDDSLQKLVDGYDLEKVEYLMHQHLATKPVRGVYKSRNPVYKKLIVVDKENGGKADALNVGINLSNYDYIVCIDVDCILEQDALLKMVKPFLEETNARVIASGGVVRIVNSCEIQDGRLIKVHLPKEFVPRIQTLEYIRAFLIGRMAWARLDGLLLISGAFGAFDKDIVIKAGGYDHKTVGEDMELVVRMRCYMEERNIPYKVTYIPDPLCWTEAPSSFKILGRQRNRWTRGTIETLRSHKKMFFNPQYGLLGMISYPYWLFFEYFSPIIEFTGFILLVVFTLLGLVSLSFTLTLFAVVYAFSFLYSSFAIMMEVKSFNQYKNKSDLFNLIVTALLEPVFFHPFTVWAAIKGNIDYLQKKNSWGEMTRKGFAKQPS